MPKVATSCVNPNFVMGYSSQISYQTVIYDFCFSGSRTWAPNDYKSACRIRGITLEEPVPSDLDQELLEGIDQDRAMTNSKAFKHAGVPEPIPVDLDRDLWKSHSTNRAKTVPARFSTAGLSSHILLVACGANETAKEENKRGVFTSALLEALKDVGPDKITHKDLIMRIPDLPEYKIRVWSEGTDCDVDNIWSAKVREGIVSCSIRHTHPIAHLLSHFTRRGLYPASGDGTRRNTWDIFRVPLQPSRRPTCLPIPTMHHSLTCPSSAHVKLLRRPMLQRSSNSDSRLEAVSYIR